MCRDSPHAMQDQSLSSSHDRCTPSKPLPSGWLLPSLTVNMRYSFGSRWTIAFVCWPSGNSFRIFHLNDAGGKITPSSQLWLSSLCFSKAKVSLYANGAGLLLVTANSSAPADEKPVSLQNSAQMALTVLVSPGTSQVRPHLSVSLQHLKLPQQPVKLWALSGFPSFKCQCPSAVVPKTAWSCLSAILHGPGTNFCVS